MENTFERKSIDNVSLFFRIWPVDSPQGIICVVHGLGEHSGRYQGLAHILNQEGFTVISFDHRGHGCSEGKRGVIPDYQTLLDDVSLLIKEGAKTDLKAPLFLYGHSMGGNLVINYALKEQPTLKGVIATSPALRTPTPKTKRALSNILSVLWPTLTLPNGIDASKLCRCSKQVDKYLSDPLVHDKISVRLASGLISQGLWAIDNAKLLTNPLLLLHGESDAICLPEGSVQFAKNCGEACTLKLYPGLYHELHNEPENTTVIDDLLAWLKNLC